MTNTRLKEEGILRLKSYKRITTKIAGEMDKSTATIDRWLNTEKPNYERITHPDFINLVSKLTGGELNLKDNNYTVKV